MTLRFCFCSALGEVLLRCLGCRLWGMLASSKGGVSSGGRGGKYGKYFLVLTCLKESREVLGIWNLGI